MIALAWRLALRELRSGLRGFSVFIAALALGVAAMAAVGTVAANISRGLSDKGREILAGDIELRLTQHPANEAQRAYFDQHAARWSAIVQISAMAHAPASGRRLLVGLKAVDGGYPLYGALGLTPALPVAEALGLRDGYYGVAVEPRLAERLGVKPGDAVEIGDQVFEFRALIAAEPDKVSDGFELGPRALISRDGLAASKLVRPGSIVRYRYRLGLDESVDLDAWIAGLSARFPDAGWQITDRRDAAPRLKRMIGNLSVFLHFIGLLTLVVGGVGIAGGVRGYLDRRRRSIIGLKTLGAPGALIFRLYAIEIALVAAAAILIGLGLGAALPFALHGVLARSLPMAIDLGLAPGALALAAAQGALITFIFAFAPLIRARRTPVRLFRQVAAKRVEKQSLLVIGLATALMAALAVVTTGDPWFALGFLVALAAGFALLWGLGAGIEGLARRLPRPRHPSLRLAIANLHRPGAPTRAVVLALGLGLSLFTALIVVEANFAHEIDSVVPDQAPAFFFIDIQKAERAEFAAVVAGVKGVGAVEIVPALRGPITRVKGVPADEVVPLDPEVAWVLRGDRGISYAALPPDNSPVTKGDWWPAGYRGPPLLSMGEEQARGLGLDVGDPLTLNILGREITARIANLRAIDWGSFGFNFVILLSPGVMEQAPHGYWATVAADGPAEAAVYDAVTRRFPGISVISVKEVLNSVGNTLTGLAEAVGLAALVTILAGILVLSGAIAAGQQARLHDAVVLKLLGASRARILGTMLIEYALIGLIVGLLALGLGGVGGYVIIDYLFEFSWILPAKAMLTSLGLALLLSIGFGLALNWHILGARPARLLADTPV